MRRIAGAGLAVVGAVICLGCFVSTTTTVSQLTPGTGATVTLTEQGRAALVPQAGPGVLRLRGTVTARSDTSIDLSVSMVEYLDGSVNQWQGQQVLVPFGHAALVVERRFSKKRSWMLAGTAIGAISAVVASSIGERSGSGGTGGVRPTPPPP